MMFPLDIQAKKSPDSPALFWQDKQYSFAEILKLVMQYSSFIGGRLKGNPKRIALLAEPSDKWIFTALATWRMGCTLIPLSTSWTESEVQEAITLTTPDIIIHSENISTSSMMVKTLLLPDITEVESEPNGLLELELGFNPDFKALIIFTSGSTGIPKRVVLEWQSLIKHAEMSENHLRYSAEDRWMICLPLHHIGSISTLIKSIVTGLSAILEPCFDAGQIHKSIEHHKATILSLVPTMLQRLVDCSDEAPIPPSVRSILIGGGHIPPKLMLTDDRLLATYGMSEAGSQITTVLLDSPVEIRLTSGLPLPGVKIRIVDEDNIIVNTGEQGEILVNSPAMFCGYDRDTQLTSETIHEGWLRSGDCGSLDKNGALTIYSRRSDRIISGGENIDPAEVENALLDTGGVKDVKVFSLPDEAWGQSVVAAIIPEQGFYLNSTELELSLKKRLSSFKVPQRWFFVNKFPLLAVGKIDLNRLREMFESKK